MLNFQHKIVIIPIITVGLLSGCSSNKSLSDLTWEKCAEASGAKEVMQQVYDKTQSKSEANRAYKYHALSKCGSGQIAHYMRNGW